MVATFGIRSEGSRSRKVHWLSEGKPEESSGIEEGTLGTNWKPRTRQSEGRQSEKKIAKKLGARVHPNSGALRIKHDASDDETLYEIKDANKSFTLTAEDLNTLWVRAARESKEPVYVVQYKYHGITATITINKEV